MDEREDASIAVVGARGEIVLSQDLRTQLALKPKTKLMVYRKDDKLVITKLNLPVAGDGLGKTLMQKRQHKRRAGA